MQKHIRRHQLTDDAVTLAGMHPVLARVYRHRGVQTLDELDYQLGQLPSPASLKGLPQALALLEQALREQQRILIVGDFDADGATSTAVAIRGLRMLGAQHLDFLVPNRFEYGYGLTPGIVELARGRKPDLIITVDNGISSLEGVAAARAIGMRVLVTDHHLPGAELPYADAIVNPNQPGCPFPDKALAGVGVMFYLLLALRSHLREQNWFAGRSEPNLAQLLDLVALGTVADVVPLSHTNRTLVQQGLLRIRAGQCCAGIRALADIAGRALPRLVASDFGFAIGPRLNAAGRLDDMSHGIACLLTDNLDTAQQYARELDALNRERRTIEGGMQQEALNDARLRHWAAQPAEQLPWSLCLYDSSWHQGVIGILAGRIKDQFHRPTIVFADAGEADIKGSARSISGLHIRDALDSIAARHPDILSRFGGHAMAAGLTLRREHFDRFCALFEEEVRHWLDETDLDAVLLSDGELAVEHLNLSTAELLRAAGPWGQRFAEPLFDGEFTVLSQKLVGEKHLRLQLAPAQDPATQVEGIAFGIDTVQWPNPHVTRVQLAYRLDVNEFRGLRTLQLLIQHVQPL